jgi:hypothetical protein
MKRNKTSGLIFVMTHRPPENWTETILANVATDVRT